MVVVVVPAVLVNWELIQLGELHTLLFKGDKECAKNDQLKFR